MGVNNENPASRLAEILETWTVPANSTVKKARVRAAGECGYESQAIEAMRCLVRISDRLDEIDRTGGDSSSLRHSLPQWVAAVLSESQAFGTTAQAERRAIQPDSLAHLRTMAMVFEYVGSSLTISADKVDSILAGVEDLRVKVLALGLPSGQQAYLLSLLDRIEDAIRRNDGWGAATAANEFVGATVTMEKREREPGRKKQWKSMRAAIGVEVISQLVATATIQGVGLLLPMIGS